jgi:pyruvate dehydrogenase E2 component (dihydrolipoamide acetyltransferase)
MASEFKLPEIADGVESGDVLEIFVSEGDTIAVDQDICELETDKATMNLPSTVSGKIVKLMIKEGDTVPVGGVVFEYDAADASSGNGAAPKSEPAPAEKPPEAKKPEPEPKQPEQTTEAEPEQATEPEPEPAPTPKAAPAPKPQPVQAERAAQPIKPRSSDTPVAATPTIRRLAREVGVDLEDVPGSGPGGRITRNDVLAVVRDFSKDKSAATKGQGDGFGPVRREKMPRIRKAISAQMVKSWETCPRVTNYDDADVTELERVRQSSKADYAAAGIRLTTMPFVIKAVAMSLRAHPLVNASVDMEAGEIVYHDYVNIGIAVDSERGLVVPSLRKADTLSIPDTAKALDDIAKTVREGQFDLDILKGSTFSISNLGSIGGTYSTPIINTPEVAILLIGRSRKLPVVVEDDTIAPRLMMPLSLSYDHRLVDGGEAARFLNELKSYLEAPSRLFLAP